MQVALGYDSDADGALDDAEVDPELIRYVCDGAEGDPGPQGPSGLIASRFVSWAGSRTLAPDQSRFVDVVRLDGSAEGKVTAASPVRLLAHATVLITPDLTKSGIAGEGRCGLFVPNGAPTSEEDPHAGFDRMGNFVHFSYQSPTAAHLHNNVLVPLVGALDRPAGSYDVVVKCQGTGAFNQLYTLWSADLAVTAALK